MRTQLIHCSYHKCLTQYYRMVMGRLYNHIWLFSHGHKHFGSNLKRFYRKCGDYRIASINNQALDLDRLGDFRISRFIRDPRDLVVSGCFYHRKGVEKWSRIVSPGGQDWLRVNGNIPDRMDNTHSFSSYLKSLNQEDGLIAEIEFRKYHFASMLKWPVDDPRIKTIRYEDLLGNEEDAFNEILSFYGVSWPERQIGVYLAGKFAAGKQTNRIPHIRNPGVGQWKEHFTPKVRDYFNQRYGKLIAQLGYD